VALSRITSLDGLYLDSFHAQKITVNKKAKSLREVYECVSAKYEFCGEVKLTIIIYMCMLLDTDGIMEKLWWNK
jgi:hypothetical protein